MSQHSPVRHCIRVGISPDAFCDAMKNKPHLAFLLEASSLAGGVAVIFEYANRLAHIGYPVTILSLDGKPTWFELDKNVKFVTLPSYEQFSTAVKSLGINVVCATWWKTAYVAHKCVEDNPSVRGMYLVQDIESSYYEQPLYKQAVLDSYSLGLDHWTTSRWVAAYMKSDIGKACEYIGIGVGKWNERTGKHGRSNQALAILRRQALKGVRELAEVARYLAYHHNIHLNTFGVDNGQVVLSSMHTHIGHEVDPMTNKAKILTHKRIEEFYSRAGVFLSTSLHEGFSMSPLEAMGAKCPVVMFNAVGNMEYVDDGVNCLIATSPRDMSDKAAMLCKDRKFAQELAKTAYATYTHFRDWNKPVERLSEFIDD